MDIDKRLEADVLVVAIIPRPSCARWPWPSRLPAYGLWSRAGPLANSRYLEEFTALLLSLNKNYRTHTTLRIAGIAKGVNHERP